MRVRRLLPILLMTVCLGAFATAQIPEDILVDGESHSMFSEPFTLYLADHRAEIPKLERFVRDRCTGSWRGYKGYWAIAGDKLMLTSLVANPCNESPDLIPLEVFFPESKGPIQATWFSGKLVVPLGQRVRYVHMGYESEYERYLVLTVEKGRIVKRQATYTKPK